MKFSFVFVLVLAWTKLLGQPLNTLPIYKARMEMVKHLEENQLAKIATYYTDDATVVGFDGTRSGNTAI